MPEGLKDSHEVAHTHAPPKDLHFIYLWRKALEFMPCPCSTPLPAAMVAHKTALSYFQSIKTT